MYNHFKFLTRKKNEQNILEICRSENIKSSNVSGKSIAYLVFHNIFLTIVCVIHYPWQQHPSLQTTNHSIFLNEYSHIRALRCWTFQFAKTMFWQLVLVVLGNFSGKVYSCDDIFYVNQSRFSTMQCSNLSMFHSFFSDPKFF